MTIKRESFGSPFLIDRLYHIMVHILIMRISTEKIKHLCEEKGSSLQRILCDAGVSRNAYYSLARKDSILPKSILSIANQLDVEIIELLTENNRKLEKVKLLLAKVDRIKKKHKQANRDNIRHTLLLLEEKPIERLRRALIRAQGPDIRGQRSSVS